MKVTKKNEKKISEQPVVYIIGCWARWGVQEYHWTGKWWPSHNGAVQPEVYYYNDHNGEYEEYQKVPIDYVTTGYILDWTFNKKAAEMLVNYLNEVGL